MKRIIIFLLEALLLVVIVAIIGILGWAAYANLQIESVEVNYNPEISGQMLVIDDYDIHVRTLGDLNSSTPVLIVHDFEATGSLAMSELGEKLSLTHPVIMPDLLGFGFSERLIEAGDYYSHAGQAALLASLLDTLAVERVYLVGHGYGGEIATQFALDYPDRADSIAYIASGIYPQDFDLNQQLRSLPAGLGRAFTFAFLGGGSADYSHESGNCFNCKLNPRNEYVLLEGTTDALMAIGQSPENSRVTEGITTLSIPTAVIWGAEDSEVPLSSGESLIEAINPEETLILDTAEHDFYGQNLSHVVELLVNFFDEE